MPLRERTRVLRKGGGQQPAPLWCTLTRDQPRPSLAQAEEFVYRVEAYLEEGWRRFQGGVVASRPAGCIRDRGQLVSVSVQGGGGPARARAGRAAGSVRRGEETAEITAGRW